MKNLLVLSFVFSLCTAAFVNSEIYDMQRPLVVKRKWDWKPCGYPDDPVKINDIMVSPDPPVRGQNMTVTIVGDAFSRVKEGAYADVSVKVGSFQISRDEYDLCQQARSAGVDFSCPVEPGTYNVSHTVELPLQILPALYTIKVLGYTVDDYDLTCLDIWVDFWST